MKRILIGVLIAIAAPGNPVRAQDGMLSFPNENAYVSVPSTPDLMPQGGLTVESWFYFNPAALGGWDNPTIIRKDPSGHSYILRTNSGSGGNLQWFVSTQGQGYTELASPSQMPLLSWHHLAGTYDGALMKMYLDGTLIASTPRTGPLLISSGALKLGQGDDPQETWKGYLDEIRIWSVARTAAQIQATKNLRLDNQPGLVASWHFDGNFLDVTGGHNGTPTAGPVIVPSTSPVISTYLTAPSMTPIGGPLTFQVYSSPAQVPYILEISLAGTMPGTPLPPPGTGVFPLNQPFLYSTYGGSYPYTFQGFTGLTNPAGYAFPVLNVHPNPFLIGIVIYSAFVILDGSAPLGIGKISNAQQTTITDYGPQITTITPSTGPTAGGWAVTIAGSHFQPGCTVRFDGALATNVVVAPDSITCFTPANTLGPADVVVQNPDGNLTTAAGGFTYVPTLTLTGVAPPVAAPGNPMIVTGSGFTAGLAASLGGVPLSVGLITSTSFTFVVPQGTFCAAPLVVSLPDTQTASLNGVNPAPTIVSVIGPPGVPSGGSTLLVLGSNFHPGTTLTIGGAPASIGSTTTTAIVATAPPGSGTVPLVVTSAAGCGAVSTYTYQ